MRSPTSLCSAERSDRVGVSGLYFPVRLWAASADFHPFHRARKGLCSSEFLFAQLHPPIHSRFNAPISSRMSLISRSLHDENTMPHPLWCLLRILWDSPLKLWQRAYLLPSFTHIYFHFIDWMVERAVYPRDDCIYFRYFESSIAISSRLITHPQNHPNQ